MNINKIKKIKKSYLILMLLVFFILVSSIFILMSERYIRYIQIGFSGTENINLYGKLVDQHGKPVSGALIYYEVGGRYLSSGKGILALHSDESGNFVIQNEGGHLTLLQIKHPDVEFQYPPPTYLGTHDPINRSITFYPYQRVKGGSEKLWTNTSPEKPYVVKGWRAVEYESVKSGSFNGYYKSDGRIYTLNFSGNSYNEIRKEGISDGHIKVSCHVNIKSDNSSEKNWKLSIVPLQGGIKKTDDYYLNQASLDGYQKSLEFMMNENDKDYKPYLINQRFYFKAKNSKVYGSLYIHFEPYAKEDKCRLDIRAYKVNESGSPNLAVKKH